jgi:transcriptional regulator with AAA-type ATPase domain
LAGFSIGSLFLDEIGDLSPDAQAAILRFLQEGEARPIGSLRLPTLRERKEEIPALVDHFIEKYNRRYDGNIPPLR